MHGLTVANLTPSYWYELIRNVKEAPAAQHSFGSLRLLIIGGEELTIEMASEWSQLGSKIQLLNVYGPTETIVTATAWEVKPQKPAARARRIPIGQPLGNRQLYVVDENLELLSIGVPGELCIGGDSIARGYKGLAELTAEKFVPDPWNNAPGGRMYRTGDRVRWRADAALEFIGRIDQQVKVRGHRIELG